MLHRLLVVAVVAAGFASLAAATDGFRAVTTEGARRVNIAKRPRPLPQAAMVDHQGEAFSWEELRGSSILVEFIFTTCPDICQKLSSDFGALVRAASSEENTPVRFVSVTFDPKRDTVEQLSKIAAYYGADGELWRFARIQDPRQLEETLEAFGIVAIPSPTRGFEHNAAIHGVDPSGNLALIGDVTETEEMFRWAVGAAR